MLDYSRLLTEQINPRTRGLDTLSTAKVLKKIHQEDCQVAAVVYRERKNIEKAATLFIRTLRQNKKLFFVGAGTSGRLGVLEAAECPPTFHTDPSQIQAIGHPV